MNVTAVISGRSVMTGDDVTKSITTGLRYARLRVLNADGSTSTVRLRDVTVRTNLTKIGPITWVAGVQVNNEGDEVTSPGVDIKRHLIEAGAVVSITPLRMNNTYGTLEEEK